MASTGHFSMYIKNAILAALAFIISLLETALPFFPGFLRLDLSNLISLTAALYLHPVCGPLIELIKNLLRLFMFSGTGGVGELVGCITGSAFALTAGLIFKQRPTRAGLRLSLLLATAALALSGALVNLWIALPLYSYALGISRETLVSWSHAVIPAIHDLPTLVLYAIVPFNLLKGALLSVLAFPLALRLGLAQGKEKGRL